MEDKEIGIWRDSEGIGHEVSFARVWGSYDFTDDEIKRLLAGKEIQFRYKGKEIIGHFQYYTYKQKLCFGFKPDFDQQYEKKPVFKDSKIRIDIQREKIMSEFMRLNYYTKLLNSDGTQIKYNRIDEKERQKEGVDVEYLQNGQRYIVDEKAQMDYIFKDEPLPTFALEIIGVRGSEGWFVKQGLKTQYYMFIWPHAENKPLTLDKIKYAYYAFVEKRKLQRAIDNRYGTRDRLLKYAHELMSGKIGKERDNRIYYKESPFDQDGYLVYTKKPVPGQSGKAEEPVNLVIKRKWIESLAVSHDIIKP